MSKFRINILANFLGKGFAGLISLIFVPLYIKFMGVESYGLVGFYVSIQVIFSLLDLGLSPTLNREIARLTSKPGKEQDIRNLVRTLEIIYWILAVIIALIVVFLSPAVSRYWFKIQSLSENTVRHAVLMMGLTIAFQFPFTFYSSGLLGLQKQVLLNLINASISTLRGLGAVLILWLVSPTIQYFFGWQIIVSFFATILTSIFLWQNLPSSSNPSRFQKNILSGIWQFAAGMTGTMAVSVLLMQTDKIILSKLLSLENFGYYNIANTLASGLYVLVNPIFVSVFPHFSQLVSLEDEISLISLYHRSCQLLSVIVLPFSVIMVLFSKTILQFWTGNTLIAENTSLLLSLLTIGNALHALMHVPYALQLAYGWTKLGFYQNLISVLIFIPLLFWATPHYGALGAAIIWIILNLFYVLITIQVMYTRIIKSEKYSWYLQDVGMPLITALFIALAFYYFRPYQMQSLFMIPYLFLISFLTLTGSALATPLIRSFLLKLFFDRKPKNTYAI